MMVFPLGRSPAPSHQWRPMGVGFCFNGSVSTSSITAKVLPIPRGPSVKTGYPIRGGIQQGEKRQEKAKDHRPNSVEDCGGGRILPEGGQCGYSTRLT